MVDVEMERVVLATVLYAYIVSDEHSEAINAFELSEGMFTDNFHKTVVRAIKWLLSDGKPITDEVVFHYLKKYGQMDEDRMRLIMGQTVLGVHTYKMYYDLLQENTRLSLLEGI